MVMDEYRAYILLALFEKNQVTRSAQVYNILQGKRTGSTLYQALINDYLPFYSVYPDWQRSDFDKLILRYETQGYIKDIGKKEYIILDKGKGASASYFKEHYYPAHLNNLRYSKLLPHFWEIIQLLTQVFSEESYNNNIYNPIIQNLEHQYFVKKWLKIAEEKGWDFSGFYQEWKLLMTSMGEEKANLVAQLLTGHDWIGKTSNHVRKEKEMSVEEFNFYFKEIWHQTFDWIRDNAEQVPIFYDVLSRADWASHKGLSKTTWTTLAYIMKDYSIQDIAVIRNVKENTIGDHLIEIGIVLPEFPLQKLIPQKHQKIIQQFKESYPEKRYRDFQEKYPKIPFYQYRFMEIIRWRLSDERTIK